MPLVVALTPEQQNNPQSAALARKVTDFYSAKCRRVTIRRMAPGDVIVGLQPLKAQQQFPQWRTIEADLVLLGTPQTNVLILDQMRGGLLSESGAQVTFSPFVGEYQSLNLVASDGAGLSEITARLTATP